MVELKRTPGLKELPKKGTRTYIVDKKNGRKTAYIHFVDGLEIWEYCPDLWSGWKIVKRIIGEKEVY